MMYLGDQAVGLATSLPVFADIAQIEMGQYIPTEDELVSGKTFNHNLGVIPDFIVIFGLNISSNGNNWTKKYLEQSSALISENDYYTALNIETKVGAATISGGITTLYIADFATTTSFKVVLRIASQADAYFKANITYNYIIGKFKEVTSNAS